MLHDIILFYLIDTLIPLNSFIYFSLKMRTSWTLLFFFKSPIHAIITNKHFRYIYEEQTVLIVLQTNQTSETESPKSFIMSACVGLEYPTCKDKLNNELKVSVRL